MSCVQGHRVISAFAPTSERQLVFGFQPYAIYSVLLAHMHSYLAFLVSGILLLQEVFVQVQALRRTSDKVVPSPDYLNRINWEVFPSIFGKFE